MLGSMAAVATPIWALAAWRLASASRMSGRSFVSDEGSDRGSFLRQRQRVKAHGRRLGLRRKFSFQHRQEMLGLRHLLVERRKRRLGAFELAFQLNCAA